MSGLSGLALQLVEPLLHAPAFPAGVAGVALQLAEPPARLSFAAGIGGLALEIVRRVLTVRVYRLAAGAYLPIPGLGITLTLPEMNQTLADATSTEGRLEFEFSEANVVLNLDPRGVPAGYSAELHYPLLASYANELVVTFLPTSFLRPARVVHVL